MLGAVDFVEGGGDADAAVGEVDAADAEGGGFAPADAGVGEQEYEDAVDVGAGGGLVVFGAEMAGGFGEGFDLLVGAVDVVVLGQDGEFDAAGGVAGDAFGDALLEHHGQGAVGVSGLGGAEAGAAVVGGFQQ